MQSVAADRRAAVRASGFRSSERSSRAHRQNSAHAAAVGSRRPPGDGLFPIIFHTPQSVILSLSKDQPPVDLRNDNASFKNSSEADPSTSLRMTEGNTKTNALNRVSHPQKKFRQFR
jgi:hypothetical protein